MSFSALGRVYLAVLCEFVAWGQQRLLQGDTLVSNRQPVPSARRGAIWAVVECLCTNVCQSMVDETLASVRGKQRIEGLDMGIDGDLEERVRAVIGRWVPEEVFTPQCVILVIPLSLCPRRSHSDGRGCVRALVIFTARDSKRWGPA